MATIALMMGLLNAETKAQTAQAFVHGMISDEDHKGIGGATVSIIKATDPVAWKNSVTDPLGRYGLKGVPPGNYHLSITAIGFSLDTTMAIVVGPADTLLQVGTVMLRRSSAALGQVTVVGKRPLIEQKADRMIINVDAAVTNIGATALEVLEKSPGVTVDKDGNISLKGKQGVMVMLDGKPTYLSGADLAALLGSMNASQLDQIEIMTNPPARYDAAGNAGIINIRTKKNKARGLNGSLTAGYGQGKYWRTNSSFNLNYRTEKFNLFVNYNANFYREYTDLHLVRHYLEGDGKTVSGIFDEPTYLRRKISSNTGKLGLDYDLSKKTTLGIVTTGMLSPRYLDGTSGGYLQDAAGHTDSVTNTISTNKVRVLNGTINLNLRHVFDSTRELTADADYIQYNTTNPQLFINSTYDPNGVLMNSNELRGDLPSLIRIWSGKADYSQVLQPGFKLEGGWKSSLVQTDNTANYFDLAGNSWEADYGKTNHFLYRENINALYGNLNREGARWTLQGGLRFENTHYKGHQLGNPQKTDSMFSRQYNDLFPTAFVSYKLNTANQLTFSAGRRIDRPAYQDLNPFLFFINQYTYKVGNPFMQPQYTNNIELSHIFKGVLTTTLRYSDTRSYFTQIFRTTGDTTIFSESNLGRQRSAGVSVNAQLGLYAWWSVTLHLDAGYKKVDGYADGNEIRTDGVNAQLNANNQFRWKGGWSAELSGYYNSRDVDGQFVLYPYGQVSMGLSKQVLQSKGTIRMNWRDVFFTEYLTADISYQNVREHFTQKHDSRLVNLSFTYRFGKTLKDAGRRAQGGATDEQNRVHL
jgi:iron complex outermembrane recepter protein